MTDHKEIWLEPKAKEYAPEGRQWCQDDVWEDGVRYIRADHASQLVRDMLADPKWNDQPWARMALTVAARAIERGRHWTPSERLENLFDGLMSDADLNEALDDGQQ